MKDIETTVGSGTFGFGLHFRIGLTWLGLTSSVLLPLSAATAAEAGKAEDFPGIGKPRILFVAGEKWTLGHYRSLAFTQDSKSIVGSLIRLPGSAAQYVRQQRVGEVRSFDLAAKDGDSKIIATARNTAYDILTTASGAARDPLLLARSRYLRPETVEVVQIVKNKSEEAIIGEFQIPRREKVTMQIDFRIHLAVTPAAETLILGTMASDWKDGRPIAWGDVKAWDLRTGKTRFAEAWDDDLVLALACSGRGGLVAAAGEHWVTTLFGVRSRVDGRVVCWDDDFKKKRFNLRLPDHQVHCLAFAPDGKTLVTGGLDGMVKWIDVERGTVVKSLDVASHSGRTLGIVESLAFSLNGELLAAAVGSWNRGNRWGQTFLIDIAKAKIYKVPSSQEGHVITRVAFSPDGKYLAAGGMEGVLKLWQFAGGKKGGQKGIEKKIGGEIGGEIGPGRRGSCPPRLPQIRTCPIKASGSSSHGVTTYGGARGTGSGT